VLQCTLQYVAARCSGLRMSGKSRESLKTCDLPVSHTATNCNTLQLTVTHCNVCHARVARVSRVRVTRPFHTLQHTATHCNTLQHTATHCNACQARVATVSTVHVTGPFHTLQLTVTGCNTLQLAATYVRQELRESQECV